MRFASSVGVRRSIRARKTLAGACPAIGDSFLANEAFDLQIRSKGRDDKHGYE
jgi:hypothetical protein